MHRPTAQTSELSLGADTTAPTLVGYDGSDTAKAALAYAARRLGPGRRLIVAHAIAVPTSFIDTAYYEQTHARARERGEEAMSEVDTLVAGVPVDLHVGEGPPAQTLVELARRAGADEIVIGSRGFGAGRGMLGSVSHALLHEADRPIVILNRRAAEREARRAEGGAAADAAGEVVGYDGSSGARAALDYAIARAHGPVSVVYAYDAPSNFLGAPYFGEALASSQLAGREVLNRLQASDGLGSSVEFDLVAGPAAEAIVRAAAVREADEIVVGCRGLSRFRGAFGSVSHALLHEADRPLVVVPQRQERA
jgi:nucleotide-binding universal stress UspA family protein